MLSRGFFLSLFLIVYCTAIKEPEGADRNPNRGKKCLDKRQELLGGVIHDVCCDEGCHEVDNIEFDLIYRVCCDNGAKRRLTPVRSENVRGYYWPNGYIPYEIDSAMPSNKRTHIAQAIDHYKVNTYSIRLGPRNGETNYVYFMYNGNDGCSSAVGMVGGKQTIKVPDWCGMGSIVHEIGHALGMHHTQTREDRDNYISINFNNVPSDWTHNYNKANTYYFDDCLEYNYGSIMHYGPNLMGKLVITTKPSGIAIGNRAGLNARDIGCVNSIYSHCRVALYHDDNFGGREYAPFGFGRYDFTKLSSLEFQNDAISSMRVYVSPHKKCIISLYEADLSHYYNNNYGGRKAIIIVDNTASSTDKLLGYTLSQLEAKGFINDAMSAMSVATDRLTSDEQLGKSQQLTSPNGRYIALMQQDGNFVLYNIDGEKRAIWSTGTHGTDAAFVKFQFDNHLVVYNNNGNAKWASGTYGSNLGPNSFLVMQNDGNLCIYGENGSWYWCTMTQGQYITPFNTLLLLVLISSLVAIMQTYYLIKKKSNKQVLRYKTISMDSTDFEDRQLVNNV